MFELNKEKILNLVKSKRLWGRALGSVLALGMLLPVSFAQSPSEIRVETPKRGIPAELVDEGDYYLHPDGRKIKFLRKKDVYALKARKKKPRCQSRRFHDPDQSPLW